MRYGRRYRLDKSVNLRASSNGLFLAEQSGQPQALLLIKQQGGGFMFGDTWRIGRGQA
jgi:hypothetical protein